MIRWKKGAIAKTCVLLFVLYTVLPWIFSKKDFLSQHESVKAFTINTTGCYIPNYMENIKHIEPNHAGTTCGQRFLYIDRVSDHEVKFRTDHEISKKLGYSKLKCGYMEVKTLDRNSKGVLSQIKPITDGLVIRLSSEASIFVVCSKIPPLELQHIKTDLPQPVYTDFYVALKKKTKAHAKPNVRKKGSNMKWNVILLGMESMSRSRAHKSMPELVQYFKKEGWLEYRALQKVSKNNTILSLLSGDKDLNKQCINLYLCRNQFLFHKYKRSGYMTALGEDITVTRDSFTVKMAAYNLTDHYLNILTNPQSGNYKCYGQISSGQQMLDYAFQFSQAYEKENFFGMFLSSSFSHIGSKGIPALFQNSLIHFFRLLNSKGYLQNTFVIFFGYQDSIFGSNSFSKDVFYDIRLPAFFLWVPLQFRHAHRKKYNNLVLNQNRLMTYYDVHAFLEHVLKISDRNAVVPQKLYPRHDSLFKEISSERTCQDAHIEEALCACYNITETAKDEGSKLSLHVTLSEITQRLYSAKIRFPNTMCRELIFREVLRSHSYKRGNKTYYITAGIFDYGDVVFESLVERTGDIYRLISLHSLTEYEEKSRCVGANDLAKEFCACVIVLREASAGYYNITRK